MLVKNDDSSGMVPKSDIVQKAFICIRCNHGNQWFILDNTLIQLESESLEALA